MDDDKKTIRFIDSEYKNLFSVPDGGNIVLTFSDGETSVRACKYLDKMHVQIGREYGRGEILHICQFAEIMERNGTKYEPEKPPELPGKCFSVLPNTGELIVIKRGEKGYTPIPGNDYEEQNRRESARRNSHLGVTPQQEAAMLGGTLYGWSTPKARISAYDFYGRPTTHPRNSNTKNREPER